jgi:hypothetical protein
MIKNCLNLFILMVALFVTSPLSAQIRTGAKAGANFYDNYQTSNRYFVSKPNTGFHVGVYGDYGFSEKLYGRVEVLLSTRGLYLSEYVDGGRIDYERESSYIDIPVSANYTIWKSLNVHAGVVSSIFVDEYKSVTKDEEGFRVDEGDQFKNYERWQFGAFVGASYNFKLFDREIEAGLRYNMAVTRTNELIREVRASRDPKYMMIQVFLAYKIFEF